MREIEDTYAALLGDDEDDPKDDPKDGDDWEDLAPEPNPGEEDGNPDPPKN